MWVSTTLGRARNLGWVAACAMFIGCSSDEVTGPATNNTLFTSVTLATAPGGLTDLSSSVPDAADQFIYFVAKSPNGAGVFKVPSTGGLPSQVAAGSPFVQPTDIVLTTDNQTIVVADPAAGSIFQVAIADGHTTAISETFGTAPVALDLKSESGSDAIYYCGIKDGQKAIFKKTASGLTVLHSGPPLSAPTGIVAANDGAIYIADQSVIHRLSGGTITQIATGLTLGSPAGITLTPDEKAVVVSAKSSSGKSQATIIAIATGEQTVFNNIIGANSAPAGLHGARNANGFTGLYSWADRVRGIYRLKP